jgi:hypothetical protein
MKFSRDYMVTRHCSWPLCNTAFESHTLGIGRAELVKQKKLSVAWSERRGPKRELFAKLAEHHGVLQTRRRKRWFDHSPGA